MGRAAPTRSGFNAVAWLAASLLCACGGEPTTTPAPMAAAKQADAVSEPAVAPKPPEAASSASSERVGPASAPAPARAAPASATTVAATPDYMLVVFRGKVVHRDHDELAPVHGAGYVPLRAFVYLRNKGRSQSPVAGVQAYCLTPTRCDYVPARRSGFPERYTISVEDGSMARLSSADDMVVISTRELDVPQRRTVHVTLTIPGHEPITRQIIYATSSG